ncbi:hypothetical protein [Bacteroides faecium]|uniref:Uncharacterized protein n=1 Tax=Bacteroides faecium TaxID=2715212 RepID=A0A6H0KSR8_9BACE|nr:hypothetical protein [Bacteroides faecium]QIU96392.1 hypothetical protein BacF7301_20530 [Bacteroides faecium]
MSKCISVEKAAVKYGIAKEVIWLWVEMKKLTVSYAKGIPAIDEKEIQEFLHWDKAGITSEYIDTLEELCAEKTRVCNMYAEIINSQDRELALLREKNAKINEIQAIMKRLNVRIRDCKKELAKHERFVNAGWIKRLYSKWKR